MKALLVVNMVNDFVVPGGSFPISGAMNIISNIQSIIDYFSINNHLIFFCNDSHEIDDPEFKDFPLHCVRGTYGSGISEQFKLNFEIINVLEKNTFSAFSNKSLDRILKTNNVHEIYVCGVATEICIKLTVWSSRDLGYKTFVVTDCIAGIDYGEERAALMKMGWWDALPILSKELTCK